MDSVITPQPTADTYGQGTDLTLLFQLARRCRSRCAVDVGAEKGSVTAAFLDHGFERVIALEPYPPHLAQLRSRFAGDDRVAVHGSAAAAEDGTATLRIAHDEHGRALDYFHSLSRIDDTTHVHWTGSVEVPCRTLASMVADGSLPAHVGVLKVDTEGHDLEVVRGLGALRPEIIMVEYWLDLPDTSGTCPWRLPQLLELLQPLGYRFHVFVARHEGFESVHLQPTEAIPGEWGNVILVHEDVLHDDMIAACGAAASAAARASIAAAQEQTRAAAAATAAATATIEQGQRRIAGLERIKDLAVRLDQELDRRVAPAHALQRLADSRERAFQRFLYKKEPLGPVGDLHDLPRITVVVPVRNGAGCIGDCLASITAQGYPDLELIVVDGASTDGTLDAVRRSGASVAALVSEPDRGMYDAIGKGFDLATGDILCYLNADDQFEPGGLLRVGRHFRDHPRHAVVYHEDTVQVDGWRFPNQQQPRVSFIYLLRGHILFQDGVFFRRRAYRAVGGVDRTMRLAGDWDLWARLAREFPFHRLPHHASSFRIRAGQLSEDIGAYHSEVEAARARLQRSTSRLAMASHVPDYLLTRACNAWRRLTRSRRFFYPWPGARALPPGRPPEADAPQPRCPITREAPDRLLFSSRDTRFGDERISYVYYHSGSHLAMLHPVLDPAELERVHLAYSGERRIRTPAPGYASPYAGYRGGGRLRRLMARAMQKPSRLARSHWSHDAFAELRQVTAGIAPRAPRLLDVGCFDGRLLTAAAAAGWSCHGLEPNAEAAKRAAGLGHVVWTVSAEDAVHHVPAGVRFDVIHLGQVIEHLADPLSVLRRLSLLLEPDGVLVVSTPNLDSLQIDLFGPTWSHWHPPFHRWIFSRRSLGALAACAGLEVARFRTYSHPYWTWMSQKLNQLGLGGSVPHDIEIPHHEALRAEALCAWSRRFWDRRGRGDYCYAVLRKARP